VRRLAVIHQRAKKDGTVLSGIRRQDHGRSRPVAILAKVDRDCLIAAGTTEQTRNRAPRPTERGGSISA